MKKQKVPGYGTVKKAVDFKDSLVVFGLCIACVAVIGISFYISNINKYDSNAKTDDYYLTEKTEEDIENITVVSAKIDNSQNLADNSNAAVKSNAQSENISQVQNNDEYVVQTSANVLKFSSPLSGTLMKPFSVNEVLYSKTMDDWRMHNGIDICAKIGTTVCAVADGVVKEAKNDILYGYMIVIEHENNIQSIYCNLTGTAMVKSGKKVELGEPIGMVGDSAVFETSDEAHLHFEMTSDGNYVNPLTYFSL